MDATQTIIAFVTSTAFSAIVGAAIKAWVDSKKITKDFDGALVDRLSHIVNTVLDENKKDRSLQREQYDTLLRQYEKETAQRQHFDELAIMNLNKVKDLEIDKEKMKNILLKLQRELTECNDKHIASDKKIDQQSIEIASLRLLVEQKG